MGTIEQISILLKPIQEQLEYVKNSTNNIEATTSIFATVKQEVEQKIANFEQAVIKKDIKSEALERKMKERNIIVFCQPEASAETLENGYFCYLKKGILSVNPNHIEELRRLGKYNENRNRPIIVEH